jgi:hypothetical protein
MPALVRVLEQQPDVKSLALMVPDLALLTDDGRY